MFWVWLSKIWSDCLDHLIFVKLDTLIRWKPKRFRDHWTRVSRKGKSGHDKIAKEIRELIRKIYKANPTWGSPRIMDELKKLGIEIAKSTIEKYIEALPLNEATKYLTRDRDGVYGNYFCNQIKRMGINEVFIAPRSSWQNP